ncbi:MAG TPA: PAS domain-containing protein [Acidimicrobiia bacterium]|nr:PAS domain-containing protein [Acidimicrobiia bacterium]
MSPQHPIEMILLRQVSSYLSLPIWMMDAEGNLVFYNEPAERLLGIQFDDVGPVHAEQVGEMFRITDLSGEPVPDSDLPIVVALRKRVPHHKDVRFCGTDGVWRDVTVSALPIEGQGDRFVGVFASFWEIQG